MSTPHQGQDEYDERVFALLLARAWQASGLRLASLLGVTSPPSQSPIEIGTTPNLVGSARRHRSSAQISEAARWNCCVVKKAQRVAHEHRDAGVARIAEPRSRMANAARPRYASVFPPPVGNQITSTSDRSACSGSTNDRRFISTNAS